MNRNLLATICRPTLLLAMTLVLLGSSPALARTTLKNICRVKGQEENTLQGLGLVIGLRGTGDSSEYLPTIRSLGIALEALGSPQGKKGLLELRDAKNVALVMVTVTVPAAGARQGDKLDCTVSSIGSSKSLIGGQLFMTPLVGPQVPQLNSPQQAPARVYAFAQGPIHVDDFRLATTGRINKGCRLEEDFTNVFTKDGKINLVIDKNHADFQVAQDVAELVNSQLSFQSRDGNLAKALDQVNVQVTIPAQYRDDPVQFVSQVLSLPILEPQTDARVVINSKSGSIVIGGDVEIGAVVVTHKNLIIEAGDPNYIKKFVSVDPGQNGSAKLKNLVEALNAVKVPTADIIEIIKGLERNGKLHGALIIE